MKDYNRYCNMGLKPLLQWRFFELDINLRITIQNELFGTSVLVKGDVVKANQRFYEWIWQNKLHICEETGQLIHNYSAKNISHILSRGAHPEMAHDPRNVNILILEKHQQWETGKRENMSIYPLNRHIIELLKKEYGSISQEIY